MASDEAMVLDLGDEVFYVGDEPLLKYTVVEIIRSGDLNASESSVRYAIQNNIGFVYGISAEHIGLWEERPRLLR